MKIDGIEIDIKHLGKQVRWQSPIREYQWFTGKIIGYNTATGLVHVKGFGEIDPDRLQFTKRTLTKLLLHQQI